MTKAGSVSKYLTRTGARLWRYRFDADPIIAVDDAGRVTCDGGRRRQARLAGFATRAAAMDACQIAIKKYLESKTLPLALPAVKETVAYRMRIWLRDYPPHQCAPAVLAATPLIDLKPRRRSGSLRYDRS